MLADYAREVSEPEEWIKHILRAKKPKQERIK